MVQQQGLVAQRGLGSGQFYRLGVGLAAYKVGDVSNLTFLGGEYDRM